ncbi:MAG: L-rhamnose mutarotase [Alphaproteobacteria bacterium]|nr:L-rhamnose mutarotase [Alphaproteobacteria bacterium]
MTTRRLCFALDLRDDLDLITRYRTWHAPGGPPPAINAALRAAGVEALEIFLTGNRLFMIMQVGEAFSLEAKAAADAADPEVQAWEALMWTFQQALPWAATGEKWLACERIYALSEQPD